MNHSTETLWLLIEKRRRGNWNGRRLRVARVSKNRIEPKIGQAVVKLQIQLPDGVLNPPEVKVLIQPEHIAQPAVTVTSQTT